MIRVELRVWVTAEDDHDADQILRQIGGAVYGPSTVTVVESARWLEDDE